MRRLLKLKQTGFGETGVDRAVFPAFTSVVVPVVVFVLVLVASVRALLEAVLLMMLAHAHAVMWLDLLVFFGRLQEGQRSCISNVNRSKKEKSCTDEAHHLLS